MYFSCLITAQRHTRIISDACCDFSQVHCMPKLSVAFELWLKTTTRTSVQIMNWNQLRMAQTGWAQKDSKGVSPGRENKYSTTLLNHVMLNLWYSISQYIWMILNVFGCIWYFCATSWHPNHLMVWRTITTNPVGLAICWAGHLSKDTSGYQEEECQHAVSCCQDCCFAVFWLLFS